MEVEQVDRAPGRRVEDDALAAGHRLGEVRHVGDAGVGDDQVRLGVALDERREPGRDRRQTAAAVDQDRHAPLGRELEHRPEPVVGRVEALGARVQLDAAGAGVEAARRLLDRRLVQVEADEWNEAPLRSSRVRERAVVRGAERGMPVGLVEAEHERARDRVLVHQREQLVVVADHAVDVVAEMEVRVEDLRALGQQPPDLLVVPQDELELHVRGRRPCPKPNGAARQPERRRGARVPRVTDVLIYADTVRSPELRHEIPKLVPDPFLYVERNGDRHIVVSSMEIPVLQDLNGFQFHPLEEFGIDELRRSGIASAEIHDEIALRAVRALGVEHRDRAGELPGAAGRPAARRRRRGDAGPRDVRPAAAARSPAPSSRASAAPRPPPTGRWAPRAT